MKVLEFPLTRITLGFATGILLANYLSLSISFTFISLTVSILLFCGSLYYTTNNPKKVTLFGIATYLLACSVGITTQSLHTESFQKSNYTNYQDIYNKPHLIDFIISEKLKGNNYSDRYIATINQIDQKPSSGKIVLNIKKDSTKLNLEIGNCLRVRSQLSKNAAPKNPNQFDYSKYLNNKHIYAQLHIQKHEITISPKFEKSIWHYAARIRTKIIRNLEMNGFNKTEMNVALALILGQQQDISPEIIKDYQYAGVTHILSVSGLHVGYILIFITYTLKPIPNTKKGALIKLILIIVSLFTFAVISGFSPSVLRSVVMFSFVAIGIHLRRSVNIYHTLLVSIFFLLLFKPAFIFDVGFQLSYLALFFIIWFQPILKKLWSPKRKFATAIWNVLTVSFAAQIGTLPICLYYFHQFPSLFFIANIIIIPFLSVIMILGIVVMILAAFSSAPLLLVQLLEKSIFYLNKIINTIASFESFIIQDISFNTYLLICSYLLIISGIIWFKKPTFTKLAFTLSSIILLQITFILNRKDTETKKEWIVYNATKNSQITERTGKSVTLFTRDTTSNNSSENYSLTSYLVGNFGKLKNKEKLQNLAYFNGNKILIIDSTGIYSKKTKPDILMLTQSPKINFERLLKTIQPKMVIADGTNYKSILQQWQKTCIKEKIPFHSTNEKGFYKLN
ncbi:competence protein ComEC family protein [Flavobacterium sp. F-65]|uniref:Competence protein ComEC family protein n=1 Tax=Flavobacterium pisciphilum TaxID=2893755 RepID=A0ABS8MT71_9FLAO|nr:ComEC/Rec2 family competence protein [Flavobacterium sp. F-65]MCC9071978.1 competence protein ComEC family protein [Flavobacterium sp. F-65]